MRWRVSTKPCDAKKTLSNDLVRFVVGAERCEQTLGPDRADRPPRTIAVFRHASFFNVPGMLVVNASPAAQEVIVVAGAVYRHRFADDSYECVLDQLPDPWQAGTGVSVRAGRLIGAQ